MEKEHVCLDSCFLIDVLTGDPGAKKYLEKAEDTDLYTTEISIYEVALGILRSKKGNPSKRFDIFLSFVENINIIPCIGQFSLEAARLNATLYKKGSPIDDMDCFISGMMQSAGVSKIATRNAKHFSKIPEIQIVQY
ncbi:MAG: type II toxin-antitoxin system VapC family toxin [archaeon]